MLMRDEVSEVKIRFAVSLIVTGACAATLASVCANDF